MECLDEIIGLSRTECECLTDLLEPESGVDPTYNVSRSGLFLDELEGFNINIAQGADDCANGGIWDRMARAVENAKQDFVRNMLGCVLQQYKPRLQNFRWQLGQTTFASTLTNITGTHVGMRVSPLQIKGGFIYLKRIGVIINQVADVTLQVYNDIDGGTIVFDNSTSLLTTNADIVTWAVLDEPLELPMWDNSGNLIRYYVVMLLNGSFKPKANKKDCGCAGAKRPWAQWLDITGVSGSDVTNLQGFRVDSTYMNGISLDVEVKCKTSEIICSSEFPLDYENDGGAMNMAQAIRLRAAAKMYEEILSSDQINRFTMMDGERILGKINTWNTQYQEALVALCEDVHLDANDCLICKTTNTTLQKNLIKA